MKYPRIILTSLSLLIVTAAMQADEADDWFSKAYTPENDTSAGDIAAPAGDNIAVPVEECATYTYVNTINPDATFKKGKGGNLATGDVPNTRALQPCSWSDASARRYAEVANLYNKTFDGKVKVYLMPIPLSSAYYTPDAARSLTGDQHACIRRMFSYLDEDVTGVDIYPILGKHADEAIYSRTDHHWAPLGAYYAAAQLTSQAGVPFMDLSRYDAVEVPDYVGTMYKFSGITDIKNSPETFVYYVPRDIDYTTTYITYTLDKARRNVVRETAPAKGDFFLPFKGAATYCTFMGGDTKLTKVETPTKNGRKVLILKDSFGNAIPGYLFGSFEEVHVADCRYFTKNIVDYVKDNGITDIVFANNLGHALSQKTTSMYEHYLKQ